MAGAQKIIFKLALIVVCVSLLVGCSERAQQELVAPMEEVNGSLVFLEADSDKAPATFTQVYNSILSQSCSECHVPGGSPSQYGVEVDFSSAATAYSSLLGGDVAGLSSSGICSGVKLVSAKRPDRSYLVGVLNPAYHKPNFAGVQGCLPYSAHLQDQNLSSAEQEMIVSWINAGAPKN